MAGKIGASIRSREILPLYNSDALLSNDRRWSTFCQMTIKKPRLGLMTAARVLSAFSEGYQSYKLSDQARLINCSPQYIQYFPLILANTGRPPFILVIIDPDLLQVFSHLPW
ncbi:MAG: hypothetical protein IPP42_01830 [Saprospiraceae bacterium]|nr:hypothetical protein [Saprospiraceae bacterium]